VKIFFNRIVRKEPYGGGSHFVTAMVDYLLKKNHKVVFHLNDSDIDVAFLVDPRPGDIGYSINHILNYKQQVNPRIKILHRVNECDKRKDSDFMDNLLVQTSKYTDKTIFISEWLKKYFIDKEFKNAVSSKVIYNGCNLNHFHPKENKSKNRKIKLVTHHWSDNWLKGFDLYKFIDQNIVGEAYEFTYIGRYCKDYQPENTNLISPLWGSTLGEEIRKHDIYVTASRFEPCGMHHVEGAASGLPVIYYKDCGGINELCLNHGEEYKSFDDFKDKLELVSSNLDLYKEKISYQNLDINMCCEKFYNEILELVK
jgi:glycosyltransferase involved in cell wall biosynthesis